MSTPGADTLGVEMEPSGSEAGSRGRGSVGGGWAAVVSGGLEAGWTLVPGVGSGVRVEAGKEASAITADSLRTFREVRASLSVPVSPKAVLGSGATTWVEVLRIGAASS